MRVLLDECVPWPLRNVLGGHYCSTAQREGWAGMKNGELLSHAESAKFDLFITADQNLRYQQNLRGRSIAILMLSTNNLRRLLSAAALIQGAVAGMSPGEFRELTIP